MTTGIFCGFKSALHQLNLVASYGGHENGRWCAFSSSERFRLDAIASRRQRCLHAPQLFLFAVTTMQRRLAEASSMRAKAVKMSADVSMPSSSRLSLQQSMSPIPPARQTPYHQKSRGQRFAHTASSRVAAYCHFQLMPCRKWEAISALYYIQHGRFLFSFRHDAIFLYFFTRSGHFIYFDGIAHRHRLHILIPRIAFQLLLAYVLRG